MIASPIPVLLLATANARADRVRCLRTLAEEAHPAWW